MTNEPQGPLIEEARPLSQSSIWQYQRDFYEAKGPASWSEGIVPFRVTTGPLLAHAYLRMLMAYLDDLQERHLLDPSEPVFIIELGGGSGGFARYFLQEWFSGELLPHAQPVHYVVTDFAESNLKQFAADREISAACAADHASIARFDAEKPAPLVCTTGRVLLDRPPKNPVVVFANYLFDTLRSDAFLWDGSSLRAWRVALRAGEGSPPPEAPLLERLPYALAEFVAQPCDKAPYGDGELDRVVAAHFSDAKISFPLPLAGLQCVRFLADASPKGLLVVSTDKGFGRIDDFPESTPPHVAEHGSHSVSVNYHAFSAFVAGRGGVGLVSPTRSFPFLFASFVLGSTAATLVRTRWAFRDVFCGFSPGDLGPLEDPASGKDNKSPFAAWIAAMRLARFDSISYLRTNPALSALIVNGDPKGIRDELAETLEEIARLAHPSCANEVVFAVGLHLTQIGYYGVALPHLGRAIQAKTPLMAFALLALAMCLLGLDQEGPMREAYEKALATPVHVAQQEAFDGLHEVFKKTCARRGVAIS